MSKTILIVDDSATVRQQVRTALTSAGYTAVEAVDGQDGLNKIRTNQQIAMVICDVNMPRMNGIEMLRSVAREKVRPGLPIVMLTTEGSPALIRDAKAAGAKGWIVKPFKPRMLLAAVQKLAV